MKSSRQAANPVGLHAELPARLVEFPTAQQTHHGGGLPPDGPADPLARDSASDTADLGAQDDMNVILHSSRCRRAALRAGLRDRRERVQDAEHLHLVDRASLDGHVLGYARHMSSELSDKGWEVTDSSGPAHLGTHEPRSSTCSR